MDLTDIEYYYLLSESSNNPFLIKKKCLTYMKDIHC